MSHDWNVICLAAGKGTRMKSSLPKGLAPIFGKRLIDLPIRALEGQVKKVGLVLGHERELVETHMSENYPSSFYQVAYQDQQLGTGHAVQCFVEAFRQDLTGKYTLILNVDSPLLAKDLFEILESNLKKHPGCKGIALTFKTENPFGLGRIHRGQPGFRIIEEKDATADEKKINEVNSGLYLVETDFLLSRIGNLENKNKSNEFYLTDLFSLEDQVQAVCVDNSLMLMGVNDPYELSLAEGILMQKKLEDLMKSGVKIVQPSSITIEDGVEVSPGSTLYGPCTLMGNTKIGTNTLIEPGCVLKNSIVGENVTLKSNCYLEEAEVMTGASVGPFAHLRPGSKIGEDVRIGNFVETKKAVLKKGSKVSHLSYVGDAEVGENTNIGCGFITCNYDGAKKHKTTIGKDCYIGADSQAIAPVTIGDQSYIAASTTVSKEVPPGTFVISRGRQENKEGMAKRFLKSK